MLLRCGSDPGVLLRCAGLLLRCAGLLLRCAVDAAARLTDGVDIEHDDLAIGVELAECRLRLGISRSVAKLPGDDRAVAQRSS